MARPSFYNHNSGISYPFLKKAVGRPVAEVGATSVRLLPLPTIVDMGLITGIDIPYDPENHWFWLSEVRRTADRFYFQFQTNATFLGDFRIEFCRDVDDEEYSSQIEPTVIDLDSGAVARPLTMVDPDFLITGFMVTGDLTELAAAMSNGDVWTGISSDAIVENALVRSSYKGYVRSINLYNAPRTRSQSPDGCDPIDFDRPIPANGIHRVAAAITALLGPVKLMEGYNADIVVNPADNSITINASVNAGEGEPCEEIEEYPNESPPSGTSLLSGGPTCNQLLRSINGIGGPILRIEAGRGFRIEPDPENHKIRVYANFEDLLFCADSASGSASI